MIFSMNLRTNFLLALTFVATIVAFHARLASVEREHKDQIEALSRRFDEQDAELQDLRRQVATGPEASGRRLQEKGAKRVKGGGSGGGGGGGGSLTTKQLNIIDALDNCMELSNSPDELIVQGCDFIVRGNGNATNVESIPAGAKGNLIVGWNEGDGGDKTGLNNIIVGSNHTYSSTGGVVFGEKNTISAASATVTGGYNNTASGVVASVSGGSFNNASGISATVTGGNSNMANNSFASVSGGGANTASGSFASVSGGYSNTASGQFSSVTGGGANTASGYYTTLP